LESKSHNNYTPLSEAVLITEQVWPEGTLPLVAASILTYNHEAYIKDCIEGVLMQKTTFPVRIVIFEDCSTDKTASIIKEYVKKFPNLFFAFCQSENSWGKEIRQELLKPYYAARSVAKYIAVCEGDDYWTDPLKLQKQVDFLEANPEYALSFHGLDYLNNGKFKTKNIFKEHRFTQLDLATKGCFINTPTVVFRNILKTKPLPEWYFKLSTGDYALFLWVSSFGNIHYIPDTMAVYRQHEGGTWSVQKDIDMYTKITNNLAILYQQDFSNEVKEGFIQQNRNNLRYVVFELLQKGDFDKLNQIRKVSSFDKDFDAYLIEEIYNKHIQLGQNSLFTKFKLWLLGKVNKAFVVK